MARHSGIVLVDTNVIIESNKTRAWKALTGGYKVETVEACIAETQAGSLNRRISSQIDESNLRKSLNDVRHISLEDQYEFNLKYHKFRLHRGERALWIHALSRTDNWKLCGPDAASIRFGLKLGFRDHLVTLEQLLNDIGFSPPIPLQNHYSTKWHNDIVSEFSLANIL